MLLLAALTTLAFIRNIVTLARATHSVKRGLALGGVDCPHFSVDTRDG